MEGGREGERKSARAIVCVCVCVCVCEHCHLSIPSNTYMWFTCIRRSSLQMAGMHLAKYTATARYPHLLLRTAMRFS